MATNGSSAQIVESFVKAILNKYDDANREGLKDTPKRVGKMFNELLCAKMPNIAVFDADGYDQLIIDKGIKYYTLCEHHLIPFFGEVKVGYIPDKKIIGLSKLSRIVTYYSKMLNTQERFTQNIINHMQEVLNPLGCGVVVSGRHLCREMRGIENEGTMITSAFKGVLLTNIAARNEFLSM